MAYKKTINHTSLIQKLVSINGTTTNISTTDFINELIEQDCTHLCHIAEDDSGEVVVDYFNLVSWGPISESEDKMFISIKSSTGYKIIDRLLHFETVQIIPAIWYGKDF